MATFMGLAWVDLTSGRDVEPVLARLREAMPPDPPDLVVRVVPRADSVRLELACDGIGYERVADLVVALMSDTDAVLRAFVALDHSGYGAEHAVLAKRDGTVIRLQHVFVYPRRFGLPYRVGEPWRTTVPAGVPSTGRVWWGRIVDGRAAHSAVAGLYGVPVERIRRAALASRQAYRSLGTVGEPFAAWLDALGIQWSDPAGDSGTRLWPRPVWRDAVLRYAVPQLSGDWYVTEDLLVLQPIGLLARGILRVRRGLSVVLEPLYVPPDEPDTLWRYVPGCDVRGVWERFTTVEEGEPYMRRLVEVVRARVLPFLDRHGSLEAYLDMHGPRNPHGLWARACTEIVLERYPEAGTTLSAIRSVAESERNRPQWMVELVSRADRLRTRVAGDPQGVRAELLAGTAERRRRLGLPLADG